MARTWNRAPTGEGARNAQRDPAKGSLASSSVPKVTDRIVCCRYLRRDGNQCTAEVAEVDGEIALCIRHLALAVVMVQRRADEWRHAS